MASQHHQLLSGRAQGMRRCRARRRLVQRIHNMQQQVRSDEAGRVRRIGHGLILENALQLVQLRLVGVDQRRRIVADSSTERSLSQAQVRAAQIQLDGIEERIRRSIRKFIDRRRDRRQEAGSECLTSRVGAFSVIRVEVFTVYVCGVDTVSRPC